MERTDNELVALARSGDKRAFEQLIERHNAATRRAAFRMVQNEEVARELAHEAMLQAYLSLDRLREGARSRVTVVTAPPEWEKTTLLAA